MPTTYDLRELEVLFLDVQATSTSPQKGNPIEIAWSVSRAADPEPGPITRRLVALPPGSSIPPQVKRMTGISTRDLVDAPSVDAVGAELRAALNSMQSKVIVAHFARYERGFVDRFGLQADDAEWICTHELTQLLVPGLPRKGLRAVAGYFGANLGEERSARAHVLATSVIWSEVVDLLAEDAVTTLGELALMPRDVARTDERVYPLPRETRLGLPREPGVYRMLARDGSVLYVGKATSLKDRVNSYFRQRRLAERKMELVCRVWDLDVTPTATALEAALLEPDEIKKFEPPYNHQFRREDRRPVWVARDDFSAWSPSPSHEHPLGPFPSPASAAWLAEACRVLRGDEPAELSASQAAIDSARQNFVERHGDGEWDHARLLELGRLLHQRAGTEDEEPAVLDSPSPQADDADVLGWLEATATAAWRLVKRGEWLEMLGDADVCWVPHSRPEALREIRMRGGALVEAHDVDPEPSSTVPPPSSAPIADIDTYDRLSALLVELRRICRDGRRVTIATSRGILETESLASALRAF